MGFDMILSMLQAASLSFAHLCAYK